ncbi:MAG: carboxypeptidase regulatory-like domain-containing protein, partial [Acidobacteria bacterium]|nr:carboxypeptidase regulatory-like domain-containing protein [Acidobacteriota bacterium]
MYRFIEATFRRFRKSLLTGASTLAILLTSALLAPPATAQSGGNSTSVTGTVLDQTGAVVPGAVVEIHNPVSQFSGSATTDASGNFTISNVPFNPYHLTVNAKGFAS